MPGDGRVMLDAENPLSNPEGFTPSLTLPLQGGEKRPFPRPRGKVGMGASGLQEVANAR